MMTTGHRILAITSSFHFVVIDKSVHLRYSIQSESSSRPLERRNQPVRERQRELRRRRKRKAETLKTKRKAAKAEAAAKKGK
jgi:hypothetical protein